MAEAAPDLAAIAARLREAHATRTACAPLRTAFPALTIDLAYAVQRQNIDHALADGRRLVGRKIGLTSRAVQTQLGVDQPDFGALFADMVHGDAEELRWSAFLQPRVEAEVLFVLGRDLAADHIMITDVIAAIDHALPAIEVVDSRIANWDIGIVDTIADNASCGAIVVGGSPRRLGELDLRLCGMVIERRGEPVSLGAGAACLGHPLNAVVWLAREMVARGTPLAAGDMVLSGALGPMVAAAPGDAFEARISGLGSVRAMFGAAEGGAP